MKRATVPPFIPGVEFLPGVADELERLPSKYASQIIKKIEALAHTPHPTGSKKMHGALTTGEPYYRERSGDYRILYVIRAGLVAIVDIDDRKDVYR